VKPHRLAIGILAALAGLATTTPATAQITVGQVAAKSNFGFCSFTQAEDEINTSVAAGASYAVPPPGGVITSWTTTSWIPAPEQKLGLKVFRPAGPNTFIALAQDDRNLTPMSTNTFPVSIPVQAGDLVALHIPSHTESPSNNCEFVTTGVNQWVYKTGSAPIGVPTKFDGEYGSDTLLNVSATVLPPPTISALTPAGGSVKGGAAVTVSGSNFAEVKGVSFGAAPAAGFSVASEGQITATAPASKSIVPVTVTVTTAAGTATSTQTFTYEGCKVPKLKGKKLKASKKKLKKADCRTGKVKKRKGATGSSGKVVKQSPKPGTILPPGARVKLTLGP
jgi:PASTA domain/IPT/TIG domain